ncbi:hypothetical protein J6590_079911 [Homalodisca vitripennis]|nr:hypothetical protein J6590_079911 [Homalodisca vitripennis]
MEENEEPCLHNSEIDRILLFDVTDGMAENSEEEGDTDAEDTPLHTSVESIPSTRTSAPMATLVLSRGGLASPSASPTVPDGIVGDVPSSSCAATSKGVAGQGEEATFPYHYSSDKGRKPFPPSWFGPGIESGYLSLPFLMFPPLIYQQPQTKVLCDPC